MSYDKRDEEKEVIPEGMRKRVRKVKGKRRSKQGKSSSGSSVFEQGKDLLKAMQHNDEGERHVDIQEQVRRLKGDDADNDQNLDDTWGSKKKSSSWIWMSLIGLVLPVIGITIGVSILNKDKVAVSSDELMVPHQFETEKVSVNDGSHGWFNEDSVVHLDRALKILSDINQAESPSEITKYLRPSITREQNPVDLDKWSSPVVTESRVEMSWTLDTVLPRGDQESNKRGYITVNLKRKNGERLTAFFVYSSGEILLDWDATMAWSESPWSELHQAKPRDPKLMRALITKKASYDAIVGQVDQSGYLLVSEDGEQFIFAFIPLDSVENKKNDDDLKALLNYGRISTALKKDLRVTAKIRYGDESGKGSRFEIVDFLHEGWVRP